MGTIDVTGDKVILIEDIVGAADNNAVVEIPIERAFNNKHYTGRFFYELISEPDAIEIPPLVDGYIKDESGRTILVIDHLSTIAVNSIPAHTTLDYYPTITSKWILTLNGIGHNKKVKIKLIFV